MPVKRFLFLILSLMLAMVATSQGCCCGEKPADTAEDCCCPDGHDSSGEKSGDPGACLCHGEQVPAAPDRAVPPPAPVQKALPGIPQTELLPAAIAEIRSFPVRESQPFPPWCAPPEVRRALLVSRTT